MWREGNEHRQRYRRTILAISLQTSGKQIQTNYNVHIISIRTYTLHNVRCAVRSMYNVSNHLIY